MMAAGVRQRHGRGCRATTRCRCPWEAFVYSKRDGKKIRKSFPTRAAAVAWRDDSRSAVRQRLMQAPTSQTLGQAADAWLEGARAGQIRTRGGDRYKPATIRSYAQTLDLRVLPELGSKRLSDVTRNDLQDLAEGLHGDGRSASTISTALLPVRAIFRRAMSRGEVAVNPTTTLELPAVRGARDRISTPEECTRLLAALTERDRALWATAMYAGLRRGELLALRIEDVDLAQGVIHVRRGWDPKEGEIETKNRKHRKVPVAAALRDHLDEHLLGLAWTEGLVFGSGPATPFAGTPMSERADKAWEAAKLERVTLHECRHTFASLMIAAGCNAKALSTYMGHATIGITLDRYGHLMPGNEDEAATLLDAYLARCAPVSRQSCTDSSESERTPADLIPHG